MSRPSSGGTKRFCPYCQVTRVSKTCDGRLAHGNSYRRRLECLTCHQRWTTYEVFAEEAPGFSGTIRKGIKAKVEDQVRDACKRLAVAEDAIREAVAVAVAEIYPPGARPGGDATIQEVVERTLLQLHPVAHVRYALAVRCRSAGDCMVVLAEHMTGNGFHHGGTEARRHGGSGTKGGGRHDAS